MIGFIAEIVNRREEVTATLTVMAKSKAKARRIALDTLVFECEYDLASTGEELRVREAEEPVLSVQFTPPDPVLAAS